MKAAFQYLVTALILGGIAAAVAAAGRLDRRAARAEQQIATFSFDGAEAAFAELERSLDVAGTVPWLFGGTRADVETRRAALRYCCLLYTSPSPRDGLLSRMPSSA